MHTVVESIDWNTSGGKSGNINSIFNIHTPFFHLAILLLAILLCPIEIHIYTDTFITAPTVLAKNLETS